LPSATKTTSGVLLRVHGERAIWTLRCAAVPGMCGHVPGPHRCGARASRIVCPALSLSAMQLARVHAPFCACPQACRGRGLAAVLWRLSTSYFAACCCVVMSYVSPVCVFALWVCLCAHARARMCAGGMAMRKMEIRDSAIGPPDGRGEFSRSNRLRLNLLRMPLLRSMLASARAVAVALRPIIACFTPQLGSVYRWTSTARDVGVCWCGEAKGSQRDSLCDSGLASSVQRGVSCRRVRAWRAETRGMTWVCRTK
jgi:hypothetical protein